MFSRRAATRETIRSVQFVQQMEPGQSAWLAHDVLTVCDGNIGVNRRALARRSSGLRRYPVKATMRDDGRLDVSIPHSQTVTFKSRFGRRLIPVATLTRRGRLGLGASVLVTDTHAQLHLS